MSTTIAMQQRVDLLKKELLDLDGELKKRQFVKQKTKESSLLGAFEASPRFKDLEQPHTTRSSEAGKSGTSFSVTSLVVTNEEEAEKLRHHFDYPEIHALTFLQIGMSLGYCAYTATAWLYIGSVRHEVFPHCDEVWTEPGLRWGCEATVLAFWTFPLFCCFFLLCFFFRDLLCTRLYYEMLIHNVFLDYENVEFWQSSAVRVMVAYLFLALLMYPFSHAMYSLRKIELTFAYWLPVLSFLGLLYTSWDLETRLLSLAKYVEREFGEAKAHIAKSVFIRDYLCEVAFEDVQKHALDAGKIHTTGSYIRAIVKRAQGLIDANAPPPLKARSIFHSRFLVVFSNAYWVPRLLYCPSLDDYRARRFRKWFRLYKAYTYFLLVFLAYLIFSTVVSHLWHQRYIGSSWFTRWFSIEPFLIVPVSKSR